MEEKPAAPGTEMILLVDDECTVLKYTRKVLELHGYRVLEAVDGEDAMEMVRRYMEEIDLLLTDDMLPGMRGTELIRLFRELRPGAPAIKMSGFPENFEEYECEGECYLEKPFSPQDLLGRVRQVLDGTGSMRTPSGAALGASAR